MEISRDEVRVMTVHGAKGLEAPVVYLMDTTSTPLDNARLSFIRLEAGNDIAGASNCVVWAGRKADDSAIVRDARQRMMAEIEHEYRRLLYVAMTRAAKRLVIGGLQPGNRNDVPRGSWYDLVRVGLGNSGLTEQRDREPRGARASLHAAAGYPHSSQPDAAGGAGPVAARTALAARDGRRAKGGRRIEASVRRR